MSLFLFSPLALADDLEDALDLEESGQLLEALEAYQQLLQEGGQSQADLATIYLHSAIIQQASGDNASALVSATALLAVDPEPELPDSAPPAVAELINDARRFWSGRRLRAEVRDPDAVAPNEAAIIDVRVIDDAAALVSRVALVAGDSAIALESVGTGHREVAVTIPAAAFGTAGETLELEVRLLDRYGNVLWQGAAFSLAAGSDATTAPPATRRGGRGQRRRSLWIAGWTLLAAGLVLGGSGGALVAVDETATGEEQLTDRGRMVEILDTDVAGWLLVGCGLTALAASVILLVLSPRTRERVARSPLGAAVGF